MLGLKLGEHLHFQNSIYISYGRQTRYIIYSLFQISYTKSFQDVSLDRPILGTFWSGRNTNDLEVIQQAVACNIHDIISCWSVVTSKDVKYQFSLHAF